MTACNRCGDCCERITINGGGGDLFGWADWAHEWRDWAWYDLRDGEDCGMDKRSLRQVADAEFILAHWTPHPDSTESDVFYQCSAWDSSTRLCTAHESRPPICRDYPWYGKAPYVGAFASVRCAFWADVSFPMRVGKTLPVLMDYAA